MYKKLLPITIIIVRFFISWQSFAFAFKSVMTFDHILAGLYFAIGLYVAIGFKKTTNGCGGE